MRRGGAEREQSAAIFSMRSMAVERLPSRYQRAPSRLPRAIVRISIFFGEFSASSVRQLEKRVKKILRGYRREEPRASSVPRTGVYERVLLPYELTKRAASKARPAIPAQSLGAADRRA